MIGAAIPGLPFGGVKHSGFGRLQGVEGLREMSRAMSVVEPRLMRAPALTGRMFTGSRPRPATIQRLIRRFYGR
jgi:hypothetical protein